MSNSFVLEWFNQVKEVLSKELASKEELPGIESLYLWSLIYFTSHGFISPSDFVNLSLPD